LSYTPAANYVGAASFTYKANDGKVDSNVATVSINVVEPPDTTPPTVAITSPAAGSTLAGAVTIRVSASDNVGVKRVELYMNGTLKATAAGSSAALSWDTTQAANGSWTLQAKAYDLSDNLATSALVGVTVQNVTLDTTPPSVGVLSPGPTSTVSGTVQVSAVTSDDVGVTQVKSFVNGTLLGTSSNPTPSFPWDTTKFADGFYTVDVQAWDAAGNSTKASATSVRVANVVADTTAPTVSISAPADSSTLSGNAGITVQASDSVGVTKLELLVDGTVVESANLASTTFLLNTTTIPNGAHAISVRAYDAAGNVGSDSIKVEVQNGQLDSTEPKVTINSPKNGSTIRKNTSIKVSSSDNVGIVLVELYLDGALSARSTSPNPSFTLVASMISDGAHTLLAKAYDAAGNVGESSLVQVKK
jgi:hypothetical protein